MYSFDGVSEIFDRDRFGDVAAGPGADDGDHVLGGVGHRQREESGVDLLVAQGADDRVAAASRQVHVEQYDVGLRRSDDLDCLVAIGGLADHRDGGHGTVEIGQFAPHAGAEQCVVLDQNDTDGGHGCRLGIRISTSVPVPAWDSMTAVPPKRCTRPTIESLMPWRSGGIVAGSNPIPVSRTKPVSSVSSASTNTSMRSTSACRAALTSASRSAAIRTRDASSSGWSPTITASMRMSWSASSSVVSTSIAACSDCGSPMGAAPYNQARSSRSWRRARLTMRRGSSLRWMSTNDCSTESWRCVDTLAISSSRMRIDRSSSRSCRMRPNAGAPNIASPAITMAIALTEAPTLPTPPVLSANDATPAIRSAMPAPRRTTRGTRLPAKPSARPACDQTIATPTATAAAGSMI